MSAVRIVVAGNPAPQGSKHRYPNGGMRESSKAVAPWREAIRAETARAAAGRSFTTPVHVDVLIVLPRPKGHQGRKGILASAPEWPGVRPDLDKYVRAVLDGIVEGGLIPDDSLVVTLTAAKSYADRVPYAYLKHGAVITVEPKPISHPRSDQPTGSAAPEPTPADPARAG